MHFLAHPLGSKLGHVSLLWLLDLMSFTKQRVVLQPPPLLMQQWRTNQSFDSRTNNTMGSALKNKEFDKNSWGWSWLERWMAAKPWENRLMEQSQNDPSYTTPLLPSKTRVDSLTEKNRSKSSELCSVKVRRNNVTTRISAKPPPLGQVTRSSSSPSSEFRYDESSPSSSFCTSATPVSTILASDKTGESNNSRPSYMNLTQSTKAKRRNASNRVYMQSMDSSDPSSVNMYVSKPTRMDKSSTRQRDIDNCFYGWNGLACLCICCKFQQLVVEYERMPYLRGDLRATCFVKL